MTRVGVRDDDGQSHSKDDVQEAFSKADRTMVPVMQDVANPEIEVRREEERQQRGALQKAHETPPPAACSRFRISPKFQLFCWSQSVARETTMKISRARCSLACRSDSSAGMLR